MIFQPTYEKYSLNPAKPEFFGRLWYKKMMHNIRYSKFAAGLNLRLTV